MLKRIELLTIKEPFTKQAAAAICAEIYNSAITLFADTERASASADVFLPLLDQDETLLTWQEDGTPAAFLSYHAYGTEYELTALYVRKECQRAGIGEQLLNQMKERLTEGNQIFVKVLKNAPWSICFYEKNGFCETDERQKEMARELHITEAAWSKVFCWKKELG